MRAPKKTLVHLLTREITHANMFMKALDAMGKLDDPMFGTIPPDDTVKLVFNLSQGEMCARSLETRSRTSNILPIRRRRAACRLPLSYRDDERPTSATAARKTR